MRGGGAAGLALVTVCGIFTAYTTLQPELEKQKHEREGKFTEQHTSPEKQERVISDAIMSDFREAKKEVASSGDRGFAWGIRQALFGKPGSSPEQDAPKASPAQQADAKDAGK